MTVEKMLKIIINGAKRLDFIQSRKDPKLSG